MDNEGEYPEDLRRDLSLHNEVLNSLLAVCQLVIDNRRDLSTRRGLNADHTEGVRNLSAYDELADDTRARERLPGFRNVLIHEYVARSARAIEALDLLAPIETFMDAVVLIEDRGSSAE